MNHVDAIDRIEFNLLYIAALKNADNIMAHETKGEVLDVSNIGDTKQGEDGALYVVGFNNAGHLCWIQIDDVNIASLMVSTLKSMKWALKSINASAASTSKSGRQKNAYNRHISVVLKDLAVTQPSLSRKERMQHAVNTWKEVKIKRQTVPGVANPVVRVSTEEATVSLS